MSSTLDRSDDGPLQVVVDRPAQYLRFDPAAATVVGLLSGRVLENGGRQAAAPACDCRQRKSVRDDENLSRRSSAEQRASGPPSCRRGTFGREQTKSTVFVIRDEPAGVRLERAYASSARPEMVNLASRGARDYWSVQQTGFYAREGRPNPYQWTNGDATLVIASRSGGRRRNRCEWESRSRAPAHRSRSR